MSRERYIYACARVRANEKYLLSEEQLRRMIDARNLEDAVKILEEAGYGEEGERLNALEYEGVLQRESDKLYAFLNSLAPGAEEFKIFSLPIDYRNIKILLKAEGLETARQTGGAKAEGFSSGVNATNRAATGTQAGNAALRSAATMAGPSLMSGGSIPPEELRAAIREREFNKLTSRMKEAASEAADALARTRDPQSIDLICDKACYRELTEIAEKCKNKYLTGYVKLSIDCINLKTFARCRRMGETWSYFEGVFMEGGNISKATFVSGYDEPLQAFSQRIASSALSQASEDGGAELQEKGSFTELEKLTDDALIAYVKNAKYIAFGIEPLIGYAVGKQTEIKNVRILLSGKLAELPPETLRERMRAVYG